MPRERLLGRKIRNTWVQLPWLGRVSYCAKFGRSRSSGVVISRGSEENLEHCRLDSGEWLPSPSRGMGSRSSPSWLTCRIGLPLVKRYGIFSSISLGTIYDICRCMTCIHHTSYPTRYGLRRSAEKNGPFAPRHSRLLKWHRWIWYVYVFLWMIKHRRISYRFRDKR